MKHRAEIEWLAIDTWTRAGCLRIGGPTFETGQPYIAAATVTLNERTWEAEVKGFVGTITPAMWTAMGECFAREGAESYLFERRRPDGTIHTHRRSLAKYIALLPPTPEEDDTDRDTDE